MIIKNTQEELEYIKELFRDNENMTEERILYTMNKDNGDDIRGLFFEYIYNKLKKDDEFTVSSLIFHYAHLYSGVCEFLCSVEFTPEFYEDNNINPMDRLRNILGFESAERN